MNDAEPDTADSFGSRTDDGTTSAEEVLVLDSSTFIKEVGLMSTRGSALKHYLYSRGTALVVPQAAAEEYERNLAKVAKSKIDRIQSELAWLAQFCDGIAGWLPPGEDIIKDRSRMLARGESFSGTFRPETDGSRERARYRNSAERPPAHLKAGPVDCRIWEQCLDLLSDHDVVFVATDRDFRSSRDRSSLHPQLRAEAEDVGAGRSLTFHSGMESLLDDLKSTIAPIANDEIFEFVYEDSVETIRELLANSDCRPTRTGTIEQTRLATEAPEIIEVRLQVKDRWESPDGATSLPFELSGSCRYHLGNKRLADLMTDVVRLQTTERDGSVRSVKGSRVNLRANIAIGLGAPSIVPQRGALE